jgi:hypothetical protein
MGGVPGIQEPDSPCAVLAQVMLNVVDNYMLFI